MDISSHIDNLSLEGALMASAAAAADPGASVPTCPDWKARDLVRHTGAVHRWATGVVADRRREPWDVSLDEVVGAWPNDAALVAWFNEGCTALEAALRDGPANLDCWTFLPAPSPLAMWARRQAHETAIHRVDTELAAGTMVTSIDAAFAADGVDELLTCFAPRRRTGLRTATPCTLGVECTDADASWLVRLDAGGVHTTAGPAGLTAGADCRARGAACELYLALWRRGGTGRLAVDGERTALDLFVENVSIRWS